VGVIVGAEDGVGVTVLGGVAVSGEPFVPETVPPVLVNDARAWASNVGELIVRGEGSPEALDGAVAVAPPAAAMASDGPLLPETRA
jgi:hypothetical protein